jgi:hypothetical protein
MIDPLRHDAADLDDSLALRLSRWQARGARQDAQLTARAAVAAVLIGCGLTAWLVVVIYLRWITVVVQPT